MSWEALATALGKKYPYPKVLLGFILGPVRVETNGGGDRYIGKNAAICGQGPMDIDGKTYAVTHLQKLSKFGFLIMEPFCFHFWFTFRYQQKDANGTWIPASERVLYFRVGLARWDAGVGRYYCLTWYGPGLHWD